MLHVKIIDIVVSGHVIMGVVRYRLFLHLYLTNKYCAVK